MSSPTSDLPLNSTLGAAYLGTLAAALMYGLTSLQTFLYFSHPRNDKRWLSTMIMVLWVLDTIHFAFTAHGVYFYLITNFGNFAAVASPTWSILVQVYASTIIGAIVRCIFGWRVQILCGTRRIVGTSIFGIVAALSFLSAVTAYVFASRSFTLKTFEKLNKMSWLLYLGFAADVIADILIAVSLCTILLNSRTGIKSTDSKLSFILAFTVNTGLLTSICALACLITYAIWPQRFIFLGIYFAQSKLYVNALLASLNARGNLGGQKLQTSDIPTSFGARQMAFSNLELIEIGTTSTVTKRYDDI
ncbi:hypothetical protein GALMADRAFT_605176 [Galerina marginata CBS 339.88]|uniref:DUF6534 domain-containing protein n=1 Tax=Galerina marginata (strain CBS 339.88) TaxID=685588 RepID=A0A067SVN6_GALM3|nr:hypothetical protein GALMADRAFT_605176 [Galerina marginata CBS 339.88]